AALAHKISHELSRHGVQAYGICPFNPQARQAKSPPESPARSPVRKPRRRFRLNCHRTPLSPSPRPSRPDRRARLNTATPFFFSIFVAITARPPLAPPACSITILGT